MRSSGRSLLCACLVLFGSLGPATVSAKQTVHEVARGHTLWEIARRYGVTVESIRKENHLTSDEIKAGQKLLIPPKRGSESRAKRAEEPEDKAERASKPWYIQKPGLVTQVQKSAAERGVNPCNTPDPGFGIYTRWSRAPAMGQMIMPQRGGITRSGSFDVMFHFHGHEAIRKQWVQVMNGAVLVGIDLGTGSGPYAAAFQAPNVFKRLVESVERAVAEKTGRKQAHARKIGLSGWSAGYGAIQEIISEPYGKRRVDSVVLLDGLHSGYTGNSLNELQLRPFIDYAKRAAGGSRFMFVSHSSIIPPGYASTTETANFLIYKLGGRPRHSRPRRGDPMGLDLISRYTRGQFHVRGYAGNGGMDHCAHIGLYRDVLKVHIKRRWNSPRGYKARR